MSDQQPVIVIDETESNVFEDRCANAISNGYKLSSSSCGFVNAAEYDYCSSYQAIFILK